MCEWERYLSTVGEGDISECSGNASRRIEEWYLVESTVYVKALSVKDNFEQTSLRS